MSTVSGIGSGVYNPFVSQMQQLQSLFDLFNAGSASGTSSGGTTTSSDPLLGLSGTTSASDVSTGAATGSLLPSAMFGDQMGMMLIDAQAQQPNTAGGASSDPMSQFAQTLFSQIDTNGGGSISKSELESAVTAAGGSKAAADALFAQLDPNNTGSVSEQAFAQALDQTAGPGQASGGGFHHHHHMHIDGDGDGGTNSSSSGSTAQDALAALFGNTNSSSGNLAQSLFSQIDANGTGSITQSQLESAVTAAGGTKTAADALFAQLDPHNTGSVSQASFAQALQPPSPSGNTAQDAILALLNAPVQNSAAASTTSATSGTDTGNSAQDAWWALLNGGVAGSNAATTTSPTAASPADLSSALSLSAMLDQSYQINQQLYGLYANGGMGF